MPLILTTTITESDLDRFGELLYTASLNPPKPQIRLIVPIAETQAVELAQAQSFIRKAMWNEPHGTWAAVLDPSITDGSQIIAAAYWEFFPSDPFATPKPPTNPTWYPEGAARDFVKQCLEQNGAMRARMMRKPHAHLNLLVTDPAHRRRGAGSMLVRWGLARADVDGLESWVNASIIGTPLYVSHGFVMAAAGMKDTRPPAGADEQYLAEWGRMERDFGVMVSLDLWRPVRGELRPDMDRPWE